MRNSREICRQKWLLGRTHRAIAESVGVSLGAVSLALRRASEAGLSWEAVQGLGDEDLERRLYPQAAADAARPEPDCVWVHRERHRPGVTLELLLRIPANLSARSGRTRARVPVHPSADRSEATSTSPLGAKRRMDDQVFSLFSVAASFPSFIPFLLRIDGPFREST
jgi:hypothetical protein